MLTSDNEELREEVSRLESAIEQQSLAAQEQIRQLNDQLAALRLQSIPSAPLRRSSSASQSSSHSPSTTHFPEPGQNSLHSQIGGPSTSSQSPPMLPPAPPQSHGRASSASEASTDSPSTGLGSGGESSLAPPPRDPNAPLEYDFLISGTPKTGQRTHQGPADVIALMDTRIAVWTSRCGSSHWSRPINKPRCVNTRVMGTNRSKRGTHEDPEEPKTACTQCAVSRMPCVMAYQGLQTGGATSSRFGACCWSNFGGRGLLHQSSWASCSYRDVGVEVKIQKDLLEGGDGNASDATLG